MKSAYAWQLRGFLAAMGLLVAMQVIVLLAGIGPVLTEYDRRETARLSEQAGAILLGNATDEDYVHSGPFFVFSADKSLVYSNRGRGRSISEEEYLEVDYDDAVIGYYYAGDIAFLEDRANRFVVVAMGGLLGSSLLVGAVIAVAVSVRSARTLARGLGAIREDFSRLRSVGTVVKRDMPVRELTEVSSDLHEVSVILSEQDEYKRRWMQDLSHDLRTPIAGLRGQLEAMRDGVFKPSPDRFARCLQDLGRLEAMVSSIAELQAVESLGELHRRPVGTLAFLSDLEAAFRPHIESAGARLLLFAQPGHLNVDPELFSRALSNLVENAIKHGGPNTTIEIRVAEAEERQVVSVCNDGSPIPEDQRQRIFDRFFRGEDSRTTPGSGLGLSIAREIVTRHGGTISVEDRARDGVCFVMSIPKLG